MMQLRIRAALPEQYIVYLLNNGKRQYLSNNETVTLSLGEGDSVTLMQDGAMTRLQKILTAIGIFITAPLQLAYLFYAGQENLDLLIPFRIRASLRALEDCACCFTVQRGETQFQPPRVTLSGKNVPLMEYSCTASPWVFWDAYYIYACRVISGMLWILGLMGYLLTVGVTQKNLLGTLVPGVVSLAIILVAVCLLKYAKNKCAKKMETLNKRNH